MTISRTELKISDQLLHAGHDMPSIYPDIANIIYDYWIDKKNCMELFDKPFIFFGLYDKQILSLVYHAGPLDLIEAYIRHDPKLLLKIFKKDGIEGTLLTFALVGLDQDLIIKNDKPKEGAAGRLLRLYQELLPSSFVQAKKAAMLAAPIEKPQELEKIKSIYLLELTKVFEAIKNDDANTATAVKQFQEFVIHTRPARITDNRYHLNLLRLAYEAFNLLALRGYELALGGPGKSYQQFNSEVIGWIQRHHSSRLRQLLKNSLYCFLWSSYILEDGVRPERPLINDLLFLKEDPNWEIGQNTYYDDTGMAKKRVSFPNNLVDCYFYLIKRYEMSNQQLHKAWPFNFSMSNESPEKQNNSITADTKPAEKEKTAAIISQKNTAWTSRKYLVAGLTVTGIGLFALHLKSKGSVLTSNDDAYNLLKQKF